MKKLVISKAKLVLAGAGSAIALIAGCATAPGGFNQSHYQASERIVLTRDATREQVRERGQARNYASAWSTRRDRAAPSSTLAATYAGIDGARLAHIVYAGARAEHLDGRCEAYVKIEYGESISDIAQLCDVPLATLVDFNDQSRKRKILNIGDIVRIPRREADLVNPVDFNGPDFLLNKSGEPSGGWIATEGGRYGQHTSRYTVQNGDTLNEIAYAQGVSLSSLLYVNPGVDPRRIMVGQKIRIPGKAPRSMPGQLRMAPVDTKTWTQSKTKAAPKPSARKKVASAEANALPPLEEYHVVRAGQTLAWMARRYDVSLRALALANPKIDWPIVHGGDKIYLPRGANLGAGVTSERKTEATGKAISNPLVSVVETAATPHDTVSLSADGFPPNTAVEIFGGADRHSMKAIGQTKTSATGAVIYDAPLAGVATGREVVFAMATRNDRLIGYSEKVSIDHGPYKPASAGTIETPDKETSVAPEKDREGLFNRLRQRQLGQEVLIEATSAEATSVAGTVAVLGIIAFDGGKCPTLEDGAGHLYQLLGDLEGFADGDTVLVRGAETQEAPTCGGGATIKISEIESGDR